MPVACLDEAPAEQPSATDADLDVERPKSSTRVVSLGSAVAVLMLLTILQRVIGLLRNVLVCRWLDPENLGMWNLANGFLILAAPLIVLGIPGSFNRYLSHYQQRGQLRSFLRRTLMATFALTIVGLAGMFVFQETFSWLAFGEDTHISLFVGVALALAFVIGFNTCTELLTALRHVRAGAVFQTINGLLFTFLSLLLVHVWQWGALGVVWGYSLACLVTGGAMAVYLILQGRSFPTETGAEPAGAFWGRLMKFASWYWLTDLLANLFSAIDRYMIVHSAGLDAHESFEMVGQYHSSQILGTLLVSFMGMLGSMLLSYSSHDWESGQRVRVEQTLDLALKLLALSLTAGSALVVLIAPWIFHVALADKYNEGLQVLPATMAYCIWFGLMFIAKIYLWCHERAALATAGLVVGLITNVVLNWIWLPVWGLEGAVTATVIANGVALGIVVAVAHSLGLRCSIATLACLACPGLLCFSAWGTLMAVTALFVFGTMGRWLWTESQQQLAWDWIEPRWTRWRLAKAA